MSHVNTRSILEGIEAQLNQYEEELKRYTPEQLHEQPGEGEWSVGQVYTHLLNTAFHMQLKAIETCLAEAAPAAAGKSDVGEQIFALGSMPPVRIHVPPVPGYTPQNTEKADEIRARIEELRGRVRELEPQLAGAREDQTAAHPRFGGLNAAEWFQLIEMHFRHHLMQLERLRTHLGIQ